MAVCDTARTVATPLTTVDRVGDRRLEHNTIAALAAEEEATLVVVGLPRSLDGSEGPAARAVRAEVKGLRRRLPGVAVVLHDERLSTVSAAGSLRRAGVDGRRGRGVIDQVAAAVILQSYLDTAGGGPEPEG